MSFCRNKREICKKNINHLKLPGTVLKSCTPLVHAFITARLDYCLYWSAGFVGCLVLIAYLNMIMSPDIC